MYRKIYYANWIDADNNNLSLEIYRNLDAVVETKELLLSSDTVTIDYKGSDEDVFTPLKGSGAKISVLTKELITDLYTAKANEIYCKIYRNGVLLWFGYSTPCIYSSDYVKEYNVLELEFIDLLSNLDNYNYTYINNDAPAIVSFYDVIMSCISKCDIEGNISKIYLHNTKTHNGSNDLLNNLYISDRNFYDESEEKEKCKDVIEYISRYLGMTLVQYADALYFIDYSVLNALTDVVFLEYNLSAGSTQISTLKATVIDVNKNVYQGQAQISLGGVYNKIIVIANNNPMDTIIPDLFDEDDLINQNADAEKYYTTQEKIDATDYTLLTAFLKSEKNWDRLLPFSFETSAIEEVTIDNVSSIRYGAWWQKVDDFKTDDGAPSSLSWQTYFTMAIRDGSLALSTDWQTPYLALKKKEQMIFKGGYFIIDFTYIMSLYMLAHDAYNSANDSSTFVTNKYTGGFDDTWFPCRLAIGNYWYNGEKWVSYDEYNLKVSRGYYTNMADFSTGHIAGGKWYRYYDEYGYQRFVTQAVWNALPAGTVKDSGDAIQNKMRWFYSGSTRVFTTLEYYHECLLLDRFFLVHINEEGDRIFNTQKQLTNTVSYEMNLVDSSDGVAIKLPDEYALFGEMTFEIARSNHLGVFPCASTAGGTSSCQAIHISAMTFKYTTDKYTLNLLNNSTYELDVTYENVIDDDNVKEYDDIEMRVNTYTEHAGSHSYVISKKNGDTLDYVDGLGGVKPEEEVINKYHDYYSVPRFVYSNSLKNAHSITPFTLFTESTLNKTFFAGSISYVLSTNSVSVSLNQK